MIFRIHPYVIWEDLLRYKSFRLIKADEQKFKGQVGFLSEIPVLSDKSVERNVILIEGLKGSKYNQINAK